MLAPLPCLFLENERFEESVRFFVINEPPNTRRHNSKVQMKAFGSNVELVHSIAACHTHPHTRNGCRHIIGKVPDENKRSMCPHCLVLRTWCRPRRLQPNQRLEQHHHNKNQHQLAMGIALELQQAPPKTARKRKG